MSASSTYSLSTVSNLGILTARCTGFSQVHKEKDFNFIIDLELSDERSFSIKRTFKDIQRFHQELIKLFPELNQVNRTKLSLSTSIRDNVTVLFTRDKKGLAESREVLIDRYLLNLLKQPERIRQSNVFLSFFEPRASDPKPLKCSSPSEKSDSGIDLTNEKIIDSGKAVAESNSTQHGVEEYDDVDENNYSDTSSNDYEHETETETDNETFDEDYFLDFGFGDLILKTSNNEHTNPPSDSDAETSMWCSNLDKFSNILRSSMSNIHSACEITQKSQTLQKIDDETETSMQLEEINIQDDFSDTESQHHLDTLTQLQQVEYDDLSADEIDTKRLAKSNMKHYYLSTHNLYTLD